MNPMVFIEVVEQFLDRLCRPVPVERVRDQVRREPGSPSAQPDAESQYVERGHIQYTRFDEPWTEEYEPSDRPPH